MCSATYFTKTKLTNGMKFFGQKKME